MAGRVWIAAGAVFAGLAVAAGALGAHLLKDRLGGPQLQQFELAARYQFYHAVALILVGLLSMRQRSNWLRTAGIAFFLGIVLFSGGLYAHVLGGERPSFPFVHLVPFGGMTWICGWLFLAAAQLTRDSPAPERP